jgi:hypothetical protein
MKISKEVLPGVLVYVLFLIVFSTFTFGASEEPPVNSRLNGKWEGRPPEGGELTMTLTVEKDNQIRGTAIIPGGGRKGAHPDVTGTVNGNRITLETFFPSASSQARVHYNCTLANGVLQCRTKGGYRTTFKKVD